MRRWILASVLLLLALTLTSVAFAAENGQVAAPQPAMHSSTLAVQQQVTETELLTVTELITVPAASTSTVAEGVDATRVISIIRSIAARESGASLLTLDLNAGFVLDPFFVSVNGGGGTDASTFDEACSGFVSESPILTVDWEGETDVVTLFFFSDHDPSLVVQLPDGSYDCNDDAGDNVRDPQVQLETPAKGLYRIWVGSERALDLIPGMLVITTKSEFNVGSFSPSGFVQRPPAPIDTPDVEDVVPDAKVFQEALAEALAAVTDVVSLDAGSTITVSADVTGAVPAFWLPISDASPEPFCSGLINDESEVNFTVSDSLDFVRVYFEGDLDATLAIIQPDGTALCVDDSDGGANLNPLIDLVAPVPGNYAVVVGRIESETEVQGVVTVTTDETLVPALLSPDDDGEAQP